MQESRLFKIVYHLLDKEHTTASELAEKLEVSVRTIYRDIDALSGAGIPIYAETGRNGGIRLMNDFVLDKSVLSEEEKKEILMALLGMNSLQNSENSQTLQKLSAVFNLKPDNWLEVDFSRWGNNETDNEKFELLKLSIIHCKKIKIRYASSYGEISERIVQPCKLVFKSLSWYLAAFCTEKRDWRTFKVNRILDMEILNESFPRQNYPKSINSSDRECDDITLRFPKEMSYRVYDEFNRTMIRQQENGDLIVYANMPVDSWLIGFLLSFGTQAEIISPAYLKEIVAKQARLIYEKNKT